MAILEGLHPQAVWRYFEGLCGIPHGSGNTAAISNHCLAIGQALGLDGEQDAAGNVILRKPATSGYEDHPTVILQAHLDMVCEKDPGVEFDFTADPLRLRIEGDWVTADGTTLGGDDGIGVALILAVLADTNLPHPPLEAVLTTDEETGMDGAAALDGSRLTGRRMINLDSGEEGLFTVGCAGGARAHLTLPLSYAPNTLPCWQVTIDGLRGGHSGIEIHAGRHNANKRMGDLLARLPEGWRLVAIHGGEKDNVIPSRCVCTVACSDLPEDWAPAFMQHHRLSTDPDLRVTIQPVAVAPSAALPEVSAAAIRWITALPNGVQRMHPHLEGLVETSLNLGILDGDATGLHASFSVRSEKAARKQELLDQLQALTESAGGRYAVGDPYPAWEYRENSPLQQAAVAAYGRLTGRQPVIAAIHAGLECGLLSEKLPGLDAISIGPDQEHIHSPRERLNIPSVARTYAFLQELLGDL